jgi:hypothetical protein
MHERHYAWADSSAARDGWERRSLIGPLAAVMSTTFPFCVTSNRPLATRRAAAALVAGISGRQLAGMSLRGISLQHEAKDSADVITGNPILMRQVLLQG